MSNTQQQASRKRSFIRGLLAGVAVRVLFTAFFTVVLVVMANTNASVNEWAQLTRDGQFSGFTTGWFMAQSFMLIAAIASGIACAYWSNPQSWAAPLAFAVLWLAWSAFKIPEGLSMGLAV